MILTCRKLNHFSDNWKNRSLENQKNLPNQSDAMLFVFYFRNIHCSINYGRNCIYCIVNLNAPLQYAKFEGNLSFSFIFNEFVSTLIEVVKLLNKLKLDDIHFKLTSLMLIK